MCHAVNNMREVGNYVKVISKTISGGRSKELIPIGTICRIKEVCREDDDTPYYGITSINKEDVPFYYPEKELEKGQIVWVPDVPYKNATQPANKKSRLK